MFILISRGEEDWIFENDWYFNLYTSKGICI